MPDVHHETVFFSGHVQGVGFRYTVSQVAKEFEVAGTVENLTDGRVKLDVEGQTPEIEAFINMIGERMHGFIRKTERDAERRERRFSEFRIK
jgi:acylphosphatase